ncbi:helix-turn-helix domain-containing protein [Vaginisenegalia massiliensis]|uniref:helix-turn-helix domain-containing protein n=1 Tax=Vaginisenegalia massiliensis TaxID=2058294 RepID=UPI000F51CC25|nr:helix-turn-helix transcriptional regulator [Vaginisenegalia massiliensis]
MPLYDVIKKMAKEKQVTISQIEKELDLSNGAISKWNDHKPNLAPLLKVANYFQISIDDLLKDSL